MKTEVIQITTSNESEFIPKILNGFKILLEEHNKSNSDSEILLTRQETANLLSVSLVSLWKWTKEDIIPAYRIGAKVRYKKNEVLQVLKKMNQFEK
ncbi:helix-turn-helix domain-containing protein [Bizionia sp. M204]|uniref:helix-turn-helix domain-containing protein n=1 Tax=Bizionia sp. M204 TaxID=2675331 RepID=UPI002055CD31|nr:helix-turn-helix domain-containing protein [Bizionia sp. M204]UPS92830.1 helix-turn-helix domain-containing protein [Bizionia sp. M204]